MAGHKKSTRASIESTLAEAEQTHTAGRPNADPYVRFAAATLDGMFFYLVYQASNGLGNALASHLGNLPESPLLPKLTHFLAANPAWVGAHAMLLVNLCFFYLQTVFLVTHFGGSAAKILIGLRVVHLPSGRTLQVQEAILREWIFRPLSLLSVAGLAVSLFRKDRKTLHDVLTQSAVKRVHGAR